MSVTGGMCLCGDRIYPVYAGVHRGCWRRADYCHEWQKVTSFEDEVDKNSIESFRKKEWLRLLEIESGLFFCGREEQR